MGFRRRPVHVRRRRCLVLKVCEGGRVVNVHVLIATSVSADRDREILGLHIRDEHRDTIDAWLTQRAELLWTGPPAQALVDLTSIGFYHVFADPQIIGSARIRGGSHGGRQVHEL
jgi:hypothetical protein